VPSRPQIKRPHPTSAPVAPAATPGSGFAGMFGRYHKSIRFRDVLDGLSNTLMAGTTIPINFVMGDGSVQFLSESIDYRLFNALGSRGGGEAVSRPD